MTNETETEKTVEVYEDEAIVADMVERYTAATNDAERKAVVEELADELGKSVPSVRQKLVREGVYIKAKASTKGAAGPNKNTLVDELVALTHVAFSPEEADSLVKANKGALTKLVAFVEMVRERTASE
jgi:hypothetical protein